MLLALLLMVTAEQKAALAKLHDGIANARDIAELRQVLAASPLVERVNEHSGSHPHYGKRTWTVLEVIVRKRVSARAFAAAMKWKRPYVISKDVHQVHWSIVVWHSDMKSTELMPRPRIVTVEPVVGRWAFIDVMLTDRPAGDLPNLSSGPSPAYALEKYEGNVFAFTIELLDRERHRVATLK